MKTLILCTNVTEYAHAYALKLSDATYGCLDLGSYLAASQDGVKQVDWFEYVGNESIHIFDVISKKVKLWARCISAQTQLLDSEANYIESVIFPLLAMVVFDYRFMRKLLSDVEVERVLVFQQRQETIFGNSWQPGGGFYGLTLAAEACARAYNLEYHVLGARPCNSLESRVKRVRAVTRGVVQIGKQITRFDQIVSSKEIDSTNDAGKKTLVVVTKTRLNGGQKNTLVTYLRAANIEVVDLPVLAEHRGLFGSGWARDRLKRKLFEDARMVFQSEDVLDIVWSEKLVASFSSTIDKVLSSIDRISYRQRQLRTLSPACVLTEDPEIAHAAFRESIQCMNLSHSGIVDPVYLPPLPGVNLTPGLLQEGYNRSTSDINHIVKRVGVPHLDLPMVDPCRERGRNRRLLVLAKNMGRRRWETDDYGAYLAALDVVAKVCATECWSLTIKLHPSGGRPMLSALTNWRDVKETESNVQVTIEIDKALNEVASLHDIVVGCQDSTAIGEVLWMSKPVVFIDYFSNNVQREKYSNNWLRNRLVTAANAGQLEKVVSRLMTDDVYRKRYAAHCQALGSAICMQFGGQAITTIAQVVLEGVPGQPTRN